MTEPKTDGVPKEEETPPSGGAESSEASVGETDELGQLKAELDERVNDLKRVTAEYANYRKRVDRDRKLVADQATISVISGLLPVLDDLDRARNHGDLNGPFGSVAEQLTGALTKHGLVAFGEKGDPFDPNRHEAVAHMLSPEVTEPTCIDVMRRGYELGDRLVRAALVAVADPTDAPEEKPEEKPAEPVVEATKDEATKDEATKDEATEPAETEESASEKSDVDDAEPAEEAPEAKVGDGEDEDAGTETADDKQK